MLSQRLKNILLYGSTITVIIIGTALLVAIARGYRYDFLNRRITQTGLVLIDSQPNGASIFVNDKYINQKSPYRIEAADIGQMTVKLTRAGYRDWMRTFTVHPEQVSFLDYAWLLPNQLDYEKPLSNVTPTNLMPSGDHRKTYYQTKDPEIAIWQYLGQSNPQRIYTAPTSQNGSTVKEIDSLQASYDGSQLLYRVVSDNPSWFIKNIGSNDAIDILDTLKISVGTIILNPSNRNEPFWLENGNLHKLNLDAKSVGPIVQSNVNAVSIKTDKVVYSTIDPATQKTSVFFTTTSFEKVTRVPLKSTDDNGPFVLDYSRFRDTDYIYALSQTSGTLFITSDPSGTNTRQSIYGKSVKNFIVSPSGRYILTDDRGKQNTYDFELGYYYPSNTSLDELQSWLWIDDNHIIVKTAGRLRMIDYDGSNSQELSEPSDKIPSFAYQFDTKTVLYRNDTSFKQVFLIKR